MVELANGNVLPLGSPKRPDAPSPEELERARAVALRALVQTYFDQVCYPDTEALVAAEGRYLEAVKQCPPTRQQ